MDEAEAREILKDCIQEDGGLFHSSWPSSWPYMSWELGDDDITLDSRYSIAELEAIVWWMKRKI